MEGRWREGGREACGLDRGGSPPHILRVPELPEVEIAGRNLRRWCEGERVERARVHDARILADGRPRAFTTRLKGRRVGPFTRLGKHLLVDLDDGQRLWLHLGMSGKLLWRAPGEALAPHTRVELRFAHGTLCFRDPRLFGGAFVGAPEEVAAQAHLERLGPDFMALRDAEALREALEGRRPRPLKVALMDQARVAGLGNIQVAEGLFRAGLHPSTPTHDLDAAGWRALFDGLHATLAHTLAATEADEVAYVSDGAHVESPFLVYGREDEPCPRCATPLVRTKHAGRSTFLCPTCQPEP